MFSPLPARSDFQSSGNFFTRLNPDDYARSADGRALTENTRRSRLAHELFMRQQAERAEEENALLERALNGGMASIFSPPRDEQDARLQQIVQGDVNARQRGENFVWSDPQRLGYNAGLERLRHQQIQNELAPREFALNQQQFAEAQRRNFYNILNQQAEREHAAARLASDERHRRFQQGMDVANYDQRAQQHAQTTHRSDFDQMLALERRLQDQANEAERRRRWTYQDAAAGAAAGAIPPSDIRHLFAGQMDPARLALVEGYGRVAGERLEDRAAELETIADTYNSQLQQAREADQPGWFARLFGARPTPASELAAPLQQRLSANRQVHGQVYFDPETESFMRRERPGIGAVLSPGAGTMPSLQTPAPAQSPQTPARPSIMQREGARFIANGVLWEIRNGQRVALGRVG